MPPGPRIFQSKHAGDHPDVASALPMCPRVGISQGRQAEAESLMIRALEMERRMWGDRHPENGHSDGPAGPALSDRSQFAKAEPLLPGASWRIQN